MNGFLNILKPPGMSSAAVVSVIRRLSGEKRTGHAGTLDPEAAGVLPIMVGQATRLFDYLVEKEKTYVAECAFGQSTDTQDAQGQVLETGTRWPSLVEVRAAADRLTGLVWQRPGAYSAVKQDGRRLYARARSGEQVEAPLRQVLIHEIRLQGETANHGVMMTVRCGRGTYIRSLCEDLGRLCGCPAHMRFLLRAQTGPFALDTAITLEEASAFAEEGTLGAHLLPMDWPLGHLPALELPEALYRQARNGVSLPLSAFPAPEPPEGEPVRILARDQFLGIAVRAENQMHWRIVIQDPT